MFNVVITYFSGWGELRISIPQFILVAHDNRQNEQLLKQQRR